LYTDDILLIKTLFVYLLVFLLGNRNFTWKISLKETIWGLIGLEVYLGEV